MTIDGADIALLRRNHRSDDAFLQRCYTCYQKWPCITTELLDAYEERDWLRAFWDEMRAFRDWANVQFPNSTPQSKAHHLAKEAHELANNPSDTEEMADVLGLFAHLAEWEGVDLAAALRAKRLINEAREWGTPDENGVIEHLRNAKNSLASALEGRE